MNKDGTVTVKMWFKNGTYIEKKMEVKEELPTEEAEQLVSGLIEVQSTVKNNFLKDTNAQITLQGMTVRVSELIAFDFDFPSEEELEKEKAEEDM